MSRIFNVIETITVEITDEEIEELKKELKEGGFYDGYDLEDALLEVVQDKDVDFKIKGKYYTRVEAV